MFLLIIDNFWETSKYKFCHVSQPFQGHLVHPPTQVNQNNIRPVIYIGLKI